MQLEALKRQNGPVPNLRLIEEGEATGALKAEYDAAIGRAGKVFNIVKAMSLNPGTLRASMDLYGAIMTNPSGIRSAHFATRSSSGSR